MTVAFFAATVFAVIGMVLLNQVIAIPGVLVVFGLLVGLVGFNATEIMLFRLNILRLTNLNAPDDSPVQSLDPTDPNALAQAEKAARAKGYAGSSRQMRAAQGMQLRQSIQLAKSLTSPESVAPTTHEGSKHAKARTTGQASEDATRKRCSFARVSSSNDNVIRDTSSLATHIAREHFDPLVGSEQNDYMIDHFLSPYAIREQIEGGHEYYIVLSPEEKRPIGIVAVRPRNDHTLLISRFYLLKEERGKGYARSMMQLVRQRAQKTGCPLARVYLIRNNYQAILAFEHLGFTRVGERMDEIGSAYVVDNLVYEMPIR